MKDKGFIKNIFYTPAPPPHKIKEEGSTYVMQ
jgi:hypothetical protein